MWVYSVPPLVADVSFDHLAEEVCQIPRRWRISSAARLVLMSHSLEVTRGARVQVIRLLDVLILCFAFVFCYFIFCWFICLFEKHLMA